MFDWAQKGQRLRGGADRHAQNGLFGTLIRKVRTFAPATPVLCAWLFRQCGWDDLLIGAKQIAGKRFVGNIGPPLQQICN
jgi:hypothetical protein